MNKRKLVNIILKDLEEVRLLSEEVAESQDGSLIEIELALNRARLLVQEIELLRELAGGLTAIPQHSVQEIVEEKAKEEAKAKEVEVEEEEVEDQVEEEIYYPEPELEIINYEEDEFSGSEELEDEVEDFEDEVEEDEIETEEENTVEEVKAEAEAKEEEEDEEELDLDEDELEEDDWNDEDEEDLEEEVEEQKEEPAFEEVKPKPAAKIHTTVLKSGPQEGFREINIDDMDDDDMDIQPIRVSPPMGASARPPMREIPKPEDAISENNEKSVVGDKYHKERSLNETLGDNKTTDSKLMNGPITSLKAAIGLNDRFLFIREIFNNNSAKYNEMIDNLDKMEQISEAVEYLRDNLTMQKNEASMKFVDLLKRRFTK